MESLAEKIKRQEQEAKEQGISSSGKGWVKLAEGDNRFRVLSEPEMIFEKYKVGICYTDCGYEGTPKFLMYVLDRKDNRVKLWKAPYTVGTTIAGYEEDEEYTFAGYPMPYDIKVNAKNAGTKEVVYTVVPGRATTPVEPIITEELSKKTPIVDIVKKMKENKKEEHVQSGFWDEQQARKTKLKEDIDEAKAGGSTGGIEYPEEDINPDDIPF